MGHPATKHPDKVIDLTKRQISVVRANQARKASTILTRLAKCAEGKKKMSSQQIRAAEIFLRKVCPDLSSMIVEPGGGEYDNLSRQELADRAAGLIANNPLLAQLTGMLAAVSEANLVKTVESRKDDPEVAEIADFSEVQADSE